MSKHETKAEKVVTKDKHGRRKELWLPRAAGSSSDINDLVINGREARAVLGDDIVEADLERSIEGASTITVKLYDPEAEIINSRVCNQRSVAEIDHLNFELVSIAPDEDDILTLVFEDEIAAILRRMYGYMKVFRSKCTRAEFIHMLIREANRKVKAGIGWRAMEEHAKRAVKAIEDEHEARENNREKDHNRQPGLGRADRSRITVKHEAVSLAELHIIDTVLDVGVSMGCDFKLLVCSIMTITQETHAQNLDSGSAGQGPFSQEPGTWGQDYPGASLDVAECAKGFFQVALEIDKKEPSKGYGYMCQAVQKSAFPDAYDQWEDEAKHTVEVYLGGSTTVPNASGGSIEKTIIKPYSYERKKKENSWDCSKRLAEEVNWRRFVLAGFFFWMSEQQLFNSRSRARLALDEPGVDSIPFEHDIGKPITELTANVWAITWGLPPGCVVNVEDRGPADGRYLVQSTSKSLIQDVDKMSVDCHKPMKELPEPAPDTTTKTISVGGGAQNPKGSASTDDLSKVNITGSQLGSPDWGGTAAIFKQFVHPFMAEYGISPGAEKEEGHTEGSDHALYSRNAYATDYPTTDGGEAANALGRAMGRQGDSSGTFERFEVQVDGKQFSVQILWHVPDHYDHVHVGIQRI